MKKIYKLVVLSILCYSATSQTITQWNFNSATDDAATGTGTITPNIGTGSINVVGGATSSFNSGAANGGSSDPNTTDDSGFQTTTYPAQNTGDKTRGIEFATSTAGFENIIVTWDERHSNTSANTTVLQYSIDGTTFVDFQSYVSTPGDTWFNNRTANLSAVTGLKNNANAKFRIVAAFAEGTAGYVASSAASTYGTTGTLRFDMVTVSGMTAMPVNLVYFGGAQSNNEIQLNWKTSSETNHDYFAVESSNDGKFFKKIGEVFQSFSETNFKNYKFVDDGAITGKNYYRLNQFDLDGKNTPSKIIMVYKKENNSLKLSPNPAVNTLNVNVAFSTRLMIYNYMGIRQLEQALVKGNNEVSIGNFTKGIYFATFENGEVLKFVKN